MNLRLGPAAAAALRAEAQRTGLSQQEILRRAVDEHLGMTASGRALAWPESVEPPTEPMAPVTARLTLPPGASSLDLLEATREERLT